MITIKASIAEVNSFQRGNLPDGSSRIDPPGSIDEMMKKAFPIGGFLILPVCLAMFLKTHLNRAVVFRPGALICGIVAGILLLTVHEWLHAIVYPREADVTIGKLKGKFLFVALASYPLKRNRFILMCLLPFVLGIVPLIIFIVSPADRTVLNGFMFGLSAMGMISPYLDVYNVWTVLKHTRSGDRVMFYEDGLYRISREATGELKFFE